MKILNVLLVLIIFSVSLSAQKYFTKEGKVTFFSEAPMENIEAHNYKATSVYDASTGAMEWAVLIKAFQFEKALMQEHFNENYMESSKYPKSTFKGKVTEPGSFDLTEDGEYEVNVNGDLTIHGVTNSIEAPAKFIVKDGKISGESTFVVTVADYKIEIPNVVRDNIAKEVEVTINADYEKLNR